MEPWQDYYEILGVPIEATRDEIEHKYKELMKKYHPDMGGGLAGEERSKGINLAYSVLSHPSKRYAYDLDYRNRKTRKTRATTQQPPQDEAPGQKAYSSSADEKSSYTPPKQDAPPKKEKKFGEPDWDHPPWEKTQAPQNKPKAKEQKETYTPPPKVEPASEKKKPKKEKKNKPRIFKSRGDYKSVFGLIGHLVALAFFAIIPCAILGLVFGMIFYMFASGPLGISEDMVTTYVYVSILGGFWVTSGIFVIIIALTNRAWFLLLFPVVYYYVNIFLYNSYKGG